MTNPHVPQESKDLGPDHSRHDVLLRKLEVFCSNLDEGDEDLPTGLIDKLVELRNKLEGVKVKRRRLPPNAVLMSGFLRSPRLALSPFVP